MLRLVCLLYKFSLSVFCERRQIKRLQIKVLTTTTACHQRAVISAVLCAYGLWLSACFKVC